MRILLMLVCFLFCLECKAKDPVENKKDAGSVKGSVAISTDPEEQRVTEVAKKEAKKLGYNVKKMRTHLNWDGKVCLVDFFYLKTETVILSILVEVNTGKILNVRRLKKADGGKLEGGKK